MASHDECRPNGTRWDLASFSGVGYDKGRNVLFQVLWMITSGCLTTRWWCPSGVRNTVLRAFGAHIGNGVQIRHDVKIHWPWKLTVGENSWVGERTWILNLEPVTIGSNSVVSQGTFLCTGSHDRKSPTFEFDNGPIHIGHSVWIAAQSTVLRGVTVGDNATVGATSLVTVDVPAGATVLAPRAQLRDGDAREGCRDARSNSISTERIHPQ